MTRKLLERRQALEMPGSGTEFYVCSMSGRTIVYKVGGLGWGWGWEWQVVDRVFWAAWGTLGAREGRVEARRGTWGHVSAGCC